MPLSLHFRKKTTYAVGGTDAWGSTYTKIYYQQNVPMSNKGFHAIILPTSTICLGPHCCFHCINVGRIVCCIYTALTVGPSPKTKLLEVRGDHLP